MSKLINICHLTSAHTRYDTRIFIKMCSSLAKNEKYNVNLVVADGKGNENKNNVSIYDIGAKSGNRISRMTKTVDSILDKAKALNCDIYHLHDPELLSLAIKLKKLGKKVIFDSHEDVGKDILSKKWIPTILRHIISFVYTSYESYICKKLDFIVTATPFIKKKFLKINKKSLDINNFPIITELSNNTVWSEKKDEVCYVGGMAKIRGIKEIVKAIDLTKNIKLNLAGKFSEKEVQDEVKSLSGWTKVNEHGFLNREEVSKLYSTNKAGLVTLHPLVNYKDALPVKMFEYMVAGLPVISSDIKLWKEIVEGNECGICVNPFDSEEIAKAIEYIISNPTEAEKMGQNGKKAVIEKYNWDIEESKLFKIYEGLI